MDSKVVQANCETVSGQLKPTVNFNNRGAKKDCVAVCPYQLFEMQPIRVEDKAKLNLKGRIKTFFDQHKAYLIAETLLVATFLCKSLPYSMPLR